MALALDTLNSGLEFFWSGNCGQLNISLVKSSVVIRDAVVRLVVALHKDQIMASHKHQIDFAVRGGRSSAGRAPGCGPGCRGFKPRRSPHFSRSDIQVMHTAQLNRDLGRATLRYADRLTFCDRYDSRQ